MNKFNLLPLNVCQTHKPPVVAAREVKDTCKKRLILVVVVQTGVLQIIVKRKVSVKKFFSTSNVPGGIGSSFLQ
jgi:hypothetical protein